MPFEATLRIDGTFSIDNSTINVTGPAQPQIVNVSPSEYTVTMTTEGIYYFTASIAGPDNNIYQDTVAIMVMSRTAMDNLLRGIWEEMKTALAVRNINTALNYFTENTRAHYTQVFTDIYNYLPQFVQAMQDIQLVYVKDGVAKYRIRKNETYSGQTWTITYYIYFVIDSDGIWKIEIF